MKIVITATLSIQHDHIKIVGLRFGHPESNLFRSMKAGSIVFPYIHVLRICPAESAVCSGTEHNARPDINSQTEVHQNDVLVRVSVRSTWRTRCLQNMCCPGFIDTRSGDNHTSLVGVMPCGGMVWSAGMKILRKF